MEVVVVVVERPGVGEMAGGKAGGAGVAGGGHWSVPAPAEAPWAERANLPRATGVGTTSLGGKGVRER